MISPEQCRHKYTRVQPWTAQTPWRQQDHEAQVDKKGMNVCQLILTAVFVSVSISPAFAQSVRIPGTSVTLVPPAGFSLAQQYPGVEHTDARASIMVTELPVAAAKMIQSSEAPALASRGIVLISARDVSIDGKPARLLHVSQKTSAGEVLKWMLIAGDVTLGH